MLVDTPYLFFSKNALIYRRLKNEIGNCFKVGWSKKKKL